MMAWPLCKTERKKGREYDSEIHAEMIQIQAATGGGLVEQLDKLLGN